MPETSEAADRLLKAERQGLRLAIFCRTAVLGIAFVWLVSSSFSVGYDPSPWGLAVLFTLTAFGIASLAVIGTRFDRWWLKYALYATDILAICAVFVVAPVSRGADIPQILNFRIYGIYYLVPLIAMATLSLSWRLVTWCGFVAVAGWWIAFGLVVGGMDHRLSWGDVPAGASREIYDSVFLSFDFIGVGNRVEETGTLFLASLTLALAVYRARRVFFAQVAAEAERTLIARTFGEYVPSQLATRTLKDPSALAPQTRRATVMSVDIAGFTTIAEKASPDETITMLNAFFTDASEVVSAAQGVIVDFSGDGFLAAFNAPLEAPQYETCAVNATRDLLARVSENHYAGRRLAIRVGLATGEIAAGSVGGGGRRTYTVHGDTVNLSARLQEMGKTKGVPVLMDGETAKAIDGNSVRLVGETEAVRGRQGGVALYTLNGEEPSQAAAGG